MAWSDFAAAFWPAADNFVRHRAEVIAREDLAYGELSKQRLDLFVPPGDGPFPLVVFFHGGFWKTQDRKLFRWASGLYGNVGVALAREGLAVAVPSFRQGVFAHTEHDALAALTWLRAHAREHRLDPDRVSLMGHSAGGNLALALAWDPARRAGDIRSVVSLCSVYDIPRLLRAGLPGFSKSDALRYFSDDATMERLSPERGLRPGSTPVLLVTCGGDAAPLRAEHEAFRKACRAADLACEALDVPEVGHMGVVMEMGRRRDRVTRVVSRFVVERALDLGASAWALDAPALLRGELRPARPRLDEARAAAQGARTGEEAWASLAAKSLLPAGWAEPSSRVFARFGPCAACGGGGHGDHGGPCLKCLRAKIALAPPQATPPSIAAAVALASLGAETLLALEGSALGCARALVPWGAPEATRVCFCVTPSRAWRRRRAPVVEPSRYANEACDAAGMGVGAIARAFERVLDARPERDPESSLVADLESAVAWRGAAHAGLKVSASRGAPAGNRHPVGQAFSGLADPFEGLCAVWASGCAIDGVEPDGTVVIVVPWDEGGG